MPPRAGSIAMAGTTYSSPGLTVPTDPPSFFQLRARRTPVQPDSVDLLFGPIRTGRNYTVLYSFDLSPSGWDVLTEGVESNNGERTITTLAPRDPESSIGCGSRDDLNFVGAPGEIHALDRQCPMPHALLYP